jgi:hypothetical protein
MDDAQSKIVDSASLSFTLYLVHTYVHSTVVTTTYAILVPYHTVQ